MKPRTLVILAVVVAALGAFIWWVERDLPGSEERAEQAGRLLGGLEADGVARLEIEREGRRILLERRPDPLAEPADGEASDAGDAGVWWLVEPFDYRADGGRIDPLVRTLVTLDTERTLETTEVDREGLGLTEPTALLRLSSPQPRGRVWTLRVGEEMPLGGQRVVSLEGPEGERIHLVPGTFLGDLPEDAEELRDRRIVPAEAPRVQRLRIEQAGDEPGDTAAEAVVLERTGEDDPAGFRLVAPAEDRAERGEVEELLRTLTSLRVDTFLDAPPPAGEMGLDPPQAVVEVELSSGEAVRLEVGERRAAAGLVESEAGEARYGRVGSQVFTFQADDLGGMVERPVADWRSRAWAGVEMFAIERLEVRGGDDDLILERREGSWVRLPGAEEVPYTAATELLSALADAEGTDLVLHPPDPEGVGEVRTFTLGGEDFELTLTLGPLRPDGTVLGWASDRQPAVVLQAEHLEALEGALEEVRELPKPAPPPSSGQGGGAPSGGGDAASG